MTVQPYYIIRKYDSSRPFAVLANFRSFNQVIGRYATLAQAKRRAQVLNAGPVEVK